MQKIKTIRGIVNVCAGKNELGNSAATEFMSVVNDAIFKHGRATVGLSGGHSPPLLYAQLTSPEHKRQVDWTKVHFFMSDERCVPFDSKDSNWGMAQQLLFSKLNMAPSNLHPPHDPEKSPAQSAHDYEDSIRAFFELSPGQIPVFDLIQLGMGPDGHTASLFPGSKALHEKSRLVVDNFVDKFETYRITFTVPMINNAANVMFLIEGEEKSHVLAEALRSDVNTYPVQHVSPANGNLTWYVDEDAGRDLVAMHARK